MNIRTLASRAAVAGVTTALAGAGLVGISTTAAQAATVTNTYTCTIAAFAYNFDIATTVTGALPVPTYGAGAPVPKDLMPLTVSAAIPADTAAILAQYGVDEATAPDFAPALGDGSVSIPLAGPITTEDGVTTWDATGKNKPFITPTPGSYDALLPAGFTFHAETTAGPLDVPCVLKEGETAQSLGSIMLVKQSSETVAPKTVSVKKNKAVKIPVTMSADAGGVGVGKVVAKEGKKTLGSAMVKNGTATLNLGKLKSGKHKITVSYLNNPSIGASSAKVTVKVAK